MSGYVKLHRDLFDHPIVGFHVPAPRAAKGKRPVPPMMAWQWLFSKAAYKSHNVGNKGMDVKLERGQVLAARHHLASAWQWSEQNVRTFLKNLHAHGMVEINQSNGHYASVLTICNYERFQSGDDAANQSTNQSLTRESPETNHTEEGKELKEEDTTLTRTSTPVRKPLPEKSKIEAMTEALTKAAGNALNPTSPNVIMIADPLNWIDHGADFERDILPAVTVAAQKCRPQSVNTWGYFAGAVKDAMHRRIETGKSFSEAPKPSAGSSRKPSEHEINSAYLANVMKQPIPQKLMPALD